MFYFIPGSTPIWIKAPEDTSDIAMLKRVFEIQELRQYGNNVTVLYRSKDDDVIDLCKKKGYKHLLSDRVTGTEQRVIILLNTSIAPEYITRGTCMLIMITNNKSV